MDNTLEITCQDVQQLRQAGADMLLLDCREPAEHAVANIEDAMLLPMSEIEARHEELSDKKNDHIIVHCHHGMRSAQVATWLRQQGFTNVQSMAGGIDCWSTEIDQTVPRY